MHRVFELPHPGAPRACDSRPLGGRHLRRGRAGGTAEQTALPLAAAIYAPRHRNFAAGESSIFGTSDQPPAQSVPPLGPALNSARLALRSHHRRRRRGRGCRRGRAISLFIATPWISRPALRAFRFPIRLRQRSAAPTAGSDITPWKYLSVLHFLAPLQGPGAGCASVAAMH